MTVISDYASLTQAIADWAHRSDIVTLVAGQTTPYSDGFIQAAIHQIEHDISANNFGNYIRFQESAYPPTMMNGGTCPVPMDWLGPKTLQMLDGSGGLYPLIFKAATWLYNRYPLRQSDRPPAYIARDVMAPCVFTGWLNSGVLNVSAVTSGALQVGMIFNGDGLPVNQETVLSFADGTTGGLGMYSVSDMTSVTSSQAMTGGGNIFVFGPYPDTAYTIQGTYYAHALQLSATNTTNWMTTYAGPLLLAGCMVACARFLKDQDMLQFWSTDYQGRLTSLVEADKAERWAASTLQVEVS